MPYIRISVDEAWPVYSFEEWQPDMTEDEQIEVDTDSYKRCRDIFEQYHTLQNYLAQLLDNKE